MHGQDFTRIRGELLTEVELLVVAEHAALHGRVLGEDWSLPAAYSWMRYEDPDPVGRLIAASRRLAEEWSQAEGSPGLAAARSSFEAEERRRLDRANGLARLIGYTG